MLPIVLGLTGALIFGAADFMGGIAAKRISALKVTALTSAGGFVLLALALALLGGVWSVQAVLLGALAGLTGVFSISLLYACLAIGPMSILSPVTAVTSALVPMLAGLVHGERLAAIGYVALALACVAIVLVGFVPEKGAVRPSPKALGMAVAAGALIGVFLIVMDLTPKDSGVIPLLVSRGVNATIMSLTVGVLALVARRRRPAVIETKPGWRPGLILALGCGIVDATANVFLLLGLRVGELTIQSVLTALYPAGTIILAAVVMKERIAPVQVVGLVLALVAAGMLAVA